MTKEERKEYNKAHYLKNKEKVKERTKQYRLANKDKSKQWYLDNKEFHLKNCKDYYDNVVKTGDYRVYVLPNANYYVGQTSAETHRMRQHRYDGNDTTDYEILHICDTEKEAKWYEKVYHKIGFPGEKGYKSTS